MSAERGWLGSGACDRESRKQSSQAAGQTGSQAARQRSSPAVKRSPNRATHARLEWPELGVVAAQVIQQAPVHGRPMPKLRL